MNDESRVEFIAVALVVSLIVHALAMFFMRPQVMTHVTGSGAAARSHKSRMLHERPQRDDVVSIDTVKDVKALFEAPEAGGESAVPVSAAMEAFTAPIDIPVPAIPAEAAIPRLTVENAPVLSEKIHVEAADGTYAAPAMEPGALAPAAKPREAEPPPPSPLTAADIPAPVPEIEPPSLSSVPETVAETLSAALLDGDAPVPEAKAYEPIREVLAELDEKTVEEEKAAVRDLLDVSRAKDLDGAVVLESQSAAAGPWTYFRVRISPSDALKTVPKDVVILMDASGSISNERLTSCRAAAKEILRSCMNTGDRFNIVAFRDDFEYAFRTWRECDRPSYRAAEEWMDRQAAHGRTDVFATISSVLKLPRNPERPLIALVVTDGDANAGVKETSAILSKFTDLNDGLVSVYMYGVRGTANRDLIDVLTRGNRGESFIFSGQRKRAGEHIANLCEKFRDPVLSDLRIVFSASSRAETYPKLLKNLYKGECVEVLGRVPKGVDEVSFSLKGLNGAKPYEGFFTVRLSGASFDEAIPQAWEGERAIDSKLHSTEGKRER